MFGKNKTDKISLTVIDGFISYFKFSHKIYESDPCVVHIILNDVRKKVDGKQNEEEKVEVFARCCQKSVLIFLVLESFYSAECLSNLTGIKNVYDLQIDL